MQWLFSSEAEDGARGGKGSNVVFIDAKGILFIDYLQNGKTVSEDCNPNLRIETYAKKLCKMPGLPKRTIFFSGQCTYVQKRLADGKIEEITV